MPSGEVTDFKVKSHTRRARIDESLVKVASQGISLGCGVRVVSGERTGYAYTDDLSVTVCSVLPEPQP